MTTTCGLFPIGIQAHSVPIAIGKREGPLRVNVGTETQARETRVRVASAISSLLGRSIEGIEVSATVPEGAPTAQLDAPIALGILRELGYPVSLPENSHIFGEFSLSGKVLPTRGASLYVASGAVTFKEISHVACDPPAPRVLLVGAPGSGKMRLAQTYHRALGSLPGGFATLDIFSVAGLELPPLVRPFRAPYHKISEAGMIGGGTWPCPGEVSLAHCGTLLLDEIPEFRRTVLDALASSLQAGVVGHHRKGVMHTFPAVPAIVVGTANPCPCGFAGSTCECKCSSSSRARHEARLSEIQEKLGMTRVDVRR